MGIFDADVFGPSLPSMISTSDETVRQHERNMLLPIVYEGVKCMSFGYVKRGPMVSQVVTQLLTFNNEII